MKIIKKTISVFSLFFFLGCSSAPAAITSVNTRKNQAAEFTDYGNSAYDQANYDQALGFFMLALENNTAADFEEGIAKSYNSLGKTFFAIGEISRALSAFEQAQEFALLVGNPTILAQCKYNYGTLAIQDKKYDEGIRLMNEAAALAERGSDRREQAIILHGLGMAMRSAAIEKNDEVALAATLDYFQRAAVINRSILGYTELASNHYMMSLVLIRLNRLAEAKTEALNALENDRKMETSLGIAMDHRALGIIEGKNNNSETAIEHLLRSYRILTTLKLTSYHSTALDLLIETYTKSGKVEEARKYRIEREALDAGAP